MSSKSSGFLSTIGFSFIGAALTLLLLAIIRHKNTSASEPQDVAPKMTFYNSDLEAFYGLNRAFEEGKIRPTVLASQLGFNFRGVNGHTSVSGRTGLPNDGQGNCSPDSYGEDADVTRVIGDLYEGGKRETVELGYCVNRYSGRITAANDLARQLTYIDEAP